VALRRSGRVVLLGLSELLLRGAVTVHDVLSDVPDTAACRSALEVATEYCSPALLNHSVRSYLWAAHLGAARTMSVDAELLYVAAVLHDLGLLASSTTTRCHSRSAVATSPRCSPPAPAGRPSGAFASPA
jgi:HD superfamily phosphodiesterase